MSDDNIKINWLALWLTVIFLIIIGWSLGLLVRPPVAEVLYCDSADVVETIDREEQGDVAVICMDYTK